MTTQTLIVLAGLVAFAVALMALGRLKTRDLAQCAAALGLSPVPDSPTRKDTTAEGRPCHERDVARGTLAGLAATLVNRSIPHVYSPRKDRVATQFTVLALTLPTPPPATLRLQPVSWSRGLEGFTQAPPAIVPTGDAAFDEAWHLYTDAPTAALLVLDAEVRAALVGLRDSLVPAGPAWTERANATLLLGSFEITPHLARYVVFGSPTAATGTNAAQAAPLLVRLTGRRS